MTIKQWFHADGETRYTQTRQMNQRPTLTWRETWDWTWLTVDERKEEAHGYTQEQPREATPWGNDAYVYIVSCILMYIMSSLNLCLFEN